MLLMSLAAMAALGQSLPPVSPDRLTLVGERVEAFTVLGGAYGVSGGAYTFRGGDSPSLSVTKLGGSGDLGPRNPLGIGDIKWNLSLGGNIGQISAAATIKDGVLAGKELSASTFGIEFGGGANGPLRRLEHRAKCRLLLYYQRAFGARLPRQTLEGALDWNRRLLFLEQQF